jgi:purine-nucleoside phosphorylase
MPSVAEMISETVTFLQQKGFVNGDVGIVLGTGLGGFIDKMQVEQSISYSEIPNFASATFEFHKGQLIFGKVGNKKVIVMQGRFHYYEGYSLQDVTFPIRVMHALGIRSLLLSNAAGGMSLKLKKGDLVVVKDHINLLPDNPLRGLNGPAFGNRFVDMSAPYNAALIKLIKTAAKALKIKIRKGVYVAVPGPNLETKAEYKYLKKIGADMVGMSTVPEVIVANHVGLPCAAVSVITDECDPKNLQPVNISEIIAVAAEADKALSLVFEKVIREL